MSVGMMFCDIPLAPVPQNILSIDNSKIEPSLPSAGGDALTVSVVLSRLGIRSALIGRVGKDMNGRFLMEELHRNQVDAKDVIQVEGCHTAVSYILIEPDGERHFLVENSINQTLRSKDVSDVAIKEADMVFFGSALAMPGMTDDEIADLFGRAHDYGKITAMDASITIAGGPRRKMDLLKKTLKETDIFIPSYEEAAYLAQRSDIYGIIEEFRKFPLKIFGIKLGREGCILTDFKEQVRLPAYPGIRVADTTGAGDCFMGGFLCAYLQGWNLEKAGCFASAVSAYGIAKKGASTGVPDFQTVLEYVDKHGRLLTS